MKNLIMFLSVFLWAGLINAQTTFSADSRVDFEVKNFKVRTVKGHFTGMEGEIFFIPGQLEASSFYVCVDASSVDTDNEKRDNHLKNEDFFHVEKYSKICFESTNVNGQSSEYNVTGNLTMHGVTKSIVIPFRYENSTFTGEIELDRFDYDIGKDTGTFSVGKNVKLKIVAEVE